MTKIPSELTGLLCIIQSTVSNMHTMKCLS